MPRFTARCSIKNADIERLPERDKRFFSATVQNIDVFQQEFILFRRFFHVKIETQTKIRKVTYMNMYQWIEDLRKAKVKKSMPILSFPGTQLIGATVRDVCTNSDLQADMMKAVADRAPTLAAVGLMDLSVEAECFGSNVVKNPDRYPHHPRSADHRPFPSGKFESARSGRGSVAGCIRGHRKTFETRDRPPVFAGCVGPFSLAGV